MKTVVKELSYEEVLKLPKQKLEKPLKPSRFLRWLMKSLSKGELKDVNFKCRYIDMEKLSSSQPCLILMNHSCFLDLKIAQTVMYPRPMNIVCTSDGFVGKNWLMRRLGCIPTNKFVTDFVLVRNMKYALEKLKSSILMYPEASYSFDGTATPLPDTLAKCLKLLNVPVVMIKTYGAFIHNPLYNNLQLRKVDVSADVKYLLSPEEIQSMSLAEINKIVGDEFTFDGWKWQQMNNIRITEPFRADALNRVLYKCCVCGSEGGMTAKGTDLFCANCSSKWILDEFGYLQGPGQYDHVPDWYKWEREELKKEIVQNTYRLDIDVDIYMMVDLKAIYKVGNGVLSHSREGFVLDGCDGKLHYVRKPNENYSLYSDYYWYEIGDMICIGDMKQLFYCFPRTKKDVVAKARIATEEIYKSEFCYVE